MVPGKCAEAAAMRFDLERVREEVGRADTEDLLDRASIFRDTLEPEARDVIDGELFRRGLTATQVNAHRRMREDAGLREVDGSVAQCHACFRPAVDRPWIWHRLWGLLPIFPRRAWVCTRHAPPGRDG